VVFDFNLHSALLLPFVVQGLVAASVLALRGRRDGALADYLLATLLFLLTMSVMQWLLGYAGWYDAHDAHSTLMFYVPWTNTVAFGPLLYAYFRALTDQQFALHGYKRHFVPALTVIGIFASAFAVDWGYNHWWLNLPMPDHYGTKGHFASSLQNKSWIFDLAGYGSLLFYGARTLRAFRAYQHYLDANFSDTARLQFGWVRRLLLAALAALLVWFGLSIASSAGVPLGFDGWWYAFFATGILIYYLSFAGLQTSSTGRPALLFQPDAKDYAGGLEPAAQIQSPFVPLAAAETAPTSAADTGAAPPLVVETAPNAVAPDVAEWLPRLTALMETDAPWREPELTLADLAHRLRLAPAQLSRVINAGTGQNFNDFVNAYRVAEAARLLHDPAFRHYTLLAIALEAGFNSKSTFNRVFKKINGLTPSDFSAGGALTQRVIL
jgi:AraC-like DNA-binding protein